MVIIAAFFNQNQGTFFFQWVNMHQHTWISLYILENTWINCSNATALNMPDYFTGLKDFWRYFGFKIFQGSEHFTVVCARVIVFWIYFNMTQYASAMPEYVLMPLNKPDHDWVLLNILNMPEYA